MTDLTLPQTVERRNKLDISLGYCSEIDPGPLASLGPALEVRVDDPAQLVDFLLHDAEENRLYFVRHLRSGGREWEFACFARRRSWNLFCSVFSTSLAYNPLFADGKRRRLCCGGTRIIAKGSLERASHHALVSREAELIAALEMDLLLSEAMTGKNLSNGFNIGGSKSLVYVTDAGSGGLIAESDVREFSRFMARCHNSISQSLPVFIGTGSDLNFHEHGGRYYDLCSRVSPSYMGDAASARRWGRSTTGNTTAPTAEGVIACIDAVLAHLGVVPSPDRGILVKGLGGIGARVCDVYSQRGYRVYATEMSEARGREVREQLRGRLELIDEEQWGRLRDVTLFSPNSSSGSLTRDNLPVLRQIGVKAIVGGENNIRDRDLDADEVYRDFGILTFADFLLNGGGAWIVDAEMVERPVENVRDWIEKYQVPTVLKTIELATASGRSPESIFVDFIATKVKELLA